MTFYSHNFVLYLWYCTISLSTKKVVDLNLLNVHYIFESEKFSKNKLKGYKPT